MGWANNTDLDPVREVSSGTGNCKGGWWQLGDDIPPSLGKGGFLVTSCFKLFWDLKSRINIKLKDFYWNNVE